MKRQKLQETMIPPYETALREAEKSAATMEKYLHHVRQFVAHEIILPSLIQRTGIIKKCAFAV